MTDTVVLPLATYPANSYTVPSTSIADGISTIRVAVRWPTNADLTIWPDAGSTARFNFQLSRDNGATWEQWMDSTGNGGIHIDKFGNQMPALYIEGPLPAGTGRRVKGVVTLSAAIKSSATITVT